MFQPTVPCETVSVGLIWLKRPRQRLGARQAQLQLSVKCSCALILGRMSVYWVDEIDRDQHGAARSGRQLVVPFSRLRVRITRAPIAPSTGIPMLNA